MTGSQTEGQQVKVMAAALLDIVWGKAKNAKRRALRGLKEAGFEIEAEREHLKKVRP